MAAVSPLEVRRSLTGLDKDGVGGGLGVVGGDDGDVGGVDYGRWNGGGRSSRDQMPRGSLLDDLYFASRGGAAGPLPSTEEILIGKQKVGLVANVSALIAGFSIVALVEISIPDEVPDELTALYSLLSTLLIVMHLFATLISVCILPSLELMLHQLAATPDDGDHVRSQYRLYRFYVDLAWTCSMGIGILLFLLELIVLVWVKLSHISVIAAATTTALLGIGIVIFLVFGGVLRSREGTFLVQLVNHRRERIDTSATIA